MIGASTISYGSITPAETTVTSSGHEVSTALTILQTLAADDKNIPDLRKYKIFIRGVLDYAERLSTSQISSLLSILCRLSVGEGSDGLDELFILTRKYLGMNEYRYKRMGVLGVCTLIQHQRNDEEVRGENEFNENEDNQ